LSIKKLAFIYILVILVSLLIIFVSYSIFLSCPKSSDLSNGISINALKLEAPPEVNSFLIEDVINVTIQNISEHSIWIPQNREYRVFKLDRCGNSLGQIVYPRDLTFAISY
jgi:hypothetical protein